MHDELIVGENTKQGRGRGPPTDALFNRWNFNRKNLHVYISQRN